MSTFHRFRQDARTQAGLQLQEQKVELLPRLILHWDGRFGSALGLDGMEGSAEKTILSTAL